MVKLRDNFVVDFHRTDNKLYDLSKSIKELLKILESTNTSLASKNSHFLLGLKAKQQNDNILQVFIGIFEKIQIAKSDVLGLRAHHRNMMNEIFSLYEQQIMEHDLRKNNPELQELYDQYQIAVKLYQD